MKFETVIQKTDLNDLSLLIVKGCYIPQGARAYHKVLNKEFSLLEFNKRKTKGWVEVSKGHAVEEYNTKDVMIFFKTIESRL